MKGFSRLLQALTLLPFISRAVAAEKAVFAHFMVGLQKSSPSNNGGAFN